MQNNSSKNNIKKILKNSWFPFVFFLSVFVFMVGFKHEKSLTNQEIRAMESVSFKEEWAEYGNIPTYLKEKTKGLPVEMKSRIIHRMMEGEPLHILYLPSDERAEEINLSRVVGEEEEEIQVITTHEKDEADDIPDWLGHLAQEINKGYDVTEMVDVTVIDPNEVARIMKQTIHDEEERQKEVTEAIETGERPQEDVDDEKINVYKEIVKDIRSQNPDVVLIDFEFIVEHLKNEKFHISESATMGVDETLEQTYEFLETLYRPIDHFSTYVMFSDDVYQKLKFAPSERLEEQLTILTEEDFINLIKVTPYHDQLESTWVKNDILPMFYTEE